MRVRSPDRDTLSARLRVERLVARAELHPAELEERAILCVRRLRPGPAQGFSPEAFRGWELHTSELLGRIARRAGRPALGPSAGDAEAVLFRDRAEMLACLASDWARGLADSRWWWKVLLRDSPGAARVVAAFVESAEFVPAAVERMVRAGELHEFLRRVEVAQAREMRLAVAMKFGVVRALEVWEEAAARVAELVAAERAEAVRGVAGAARVDIATQAAPWREFVLEIAGMEVEEWERECFAVVALMVARAPGVLTSTAFRAKVRAWSDEVARIAPRESAGEVRAPRAEIAQRDAELPTAAPVADEVFEASAVPEAHITPAIRDIRDVPRVDEEPAKEPAPPPSAGTASEEQAAAPVEKPAHALPIPQPLPQQPARFEAPLPERIVHTAFGGALYLINAGIALGFYNDFTRPAEPGIELPLWDYVALVGHSLSGAELEEDAIWPLLAELAGRANEIPPGEGFDAEWIEGLIDQTRRRLAQALGDALLCPAHARLVLTETRLDAYFRLDELPIEVRFAGLDRDPGWLPAARRDIRFHYL